MIQSFEGSSEFLFQFERRFPVPLSQKKMQLVVGDHGTDKMPVSS